MNTQHQCENGHSFFVPGQSEDSISPAVQCPECHSYRTQPVGIPDESNEMLHGLEAMPTSTQDDMSGNPLQEGILGNDGGWKNRQVRDEAFSSVNPEFQTTELVLPQDLYRHAMKTEAAHRTGLQLPNGITDNLHATLGNLQAWVQNPYENGELRPYYNKYWKVIRPSFSKPSSVQIGVADPTMAEIINHVAQTDDITPLYEYRGRESHVKTSGPLVALAPEALAAGGMGAGSEAMATGLAAGGEAAGIGAGAGGAGLAAGGAGEAAGAAGAAGASAGGEAAGGLGGALQKVKGWGQGLAGGMTAENLGGGATRGIGMQGIGMGLNSIDDMFGMGGGGQGGANPSGVVNPPSFYARNASDENDAFPDSHDEIPKQDDGDYHQQDDGNNHEWQRDLSVDDQGGGASHAPSFQHGGPAMERFMMLLPLVKQFIDSGEDASGDPLMQGLHESLESEIPGYMDHADPQAGEELLIRLLPGDKAGKADDDDQGHSDENAGGKHEASVPSTSIKHPQGFAQLEGEGSDFLPDLSVTLPQLHARTAADTQGPTTPEQIQAVQQFLIDNAKELHLEGQELTDTVLNVPTNPLQYSDLLAKIQQREQPPASSPDGLSAGPPPPAQEEAPPGDTMPVPGMSANQQMMSAVERYADLEPGPAAPSGVDPLRGQQDVQVQRLADELMQQGYDHDTAFRMAQGQVGDEAADYGNSDGPHNDSWTPDSWYEQMPQELAGLPQNQGKVAADSVANKCPACGSHTTEMLDEEGNSRCHACQTAFKTKGKMPVKIHNESSWHVADEHGFGLGGPAPQGVPVADQVHQRDHREEQDSSHTWLDDSGSPLVVGQQYEMYTDKYDIPDLVRVEAVKPTSLIYTLTGEYGLDQSNELTREEANVERISFSPADAMNTPGLDDDSLESNNDDNTGYTGSPEQTDISAPTGLVSASVHENSNLAWLMDGVPKTSGANFTPMEQRALIEESGEARNSGLLDLLGTHYISDADDDQFIFGL